MRGCRCLLGSQVPGALALLPRRRLPACRAYPRLRPPPPAGFGDKSGDAVTTAALIKALGAHIGRPLALRVARPGDVQEEIRVVAVEAGDPAH